MTSENPPSVPVPEGKLHATDEASAAKVAAAMEAKMRDRHAVLKEKWENDRVLEVGEAGTVSAAAKDFWNQFDAERKAVSAATAELVAAPLPDPADNAATLDVLTRRVLKLSALIAQHTHALPKYDVKRALTEAGTTRAQIDKARMELVPRKKFAFRKGKNRSGKPSCSDAEGAAQSHLDGGLSTSTTSDGTSATAAGGSAAPGGPGSDDASRSNSTVAEATHCWAGKTGESLQVVPGQLADAAGSDYFLKDLVDCTIVILDSLSALKLQNLDSCTVFVGPVAGSVFVRNCTKCTVHVVARQLRIHDSIDTTWFTRTSSPPIIEDCSGMRFAAYTAVYPQLNQQLMTAGLVDPSMENTHRSTKDFKWHRAHASPNWAVLEDVVVTLSKLEHAKAVDVYGHDAQHYQSLFLWRPPAAAAVLGFSNSLLPSPEEEEEAKLAAEAAAKAQAEGADGSEDEDEL